MLTIAYGYQQPQDEDTGDVVFPALNANIAQVANHLHDGVTSALIPTTAQAILSAGWGAVGGFNNWYSQTITLPGALLYANILIQLRDSSGNLVNNRIDSATATTYVVYTNDNTQVLTAEYK